MKAAVAAAAAVATAAAAVVTAVLRWRSQGRTGSGQKTAAAAVMTLVLRSRQRTQMVQHSRRGPRDGGSLGAAISLTRLPPGK